MRLVLAFLVLGLADAGYHRHEVADKQTLMGKAFCPIVQRARAHGMSDEQIIASAVANHIPQAVIVWAQKNCGAATGRPG